MKLLLFIISLFSILSYSNESWLINKREEGSYILEQRKYARKLSHFLKNRDSSKLENKYKDVLHQNLNCEDRFLKSFEQSHKLEKILHMRKLNYLDDISLQALINEIKVQETSIKGLALDTNLYIKVSKLEGIKKFIRFSFTPFKDKRDCQSHLYKNLIKNVSKFQKSQIGLSDFDFRSLLHVLVSMALSEKLIEYSQYQYLLKINEFHDSQKYSIFTLKDYQSKLLGLERRSFALERKNFEKSKFVSQKKKKSKESRRAELYQKYDANQIIFLAGILHRFQENIQATSGELILRKDEELIYKRELNEMELYCTAVNEMQLQMEELKLNSFFNVKSFQYEDIITAAYELNVVDAETIEQFLKIEDIWNPQRTVFQKIQKWISPIGSLAVVFVTPPYNLILGMIISVGQQVINQGGEDASRVHNIINCNR